MTLLTKLEDSEEGLMGITEQEEKVHLGEPTVYSLIRDYGYKSFKEAVKVFFSIEDIQEYKIRELREKIEERFRSDKESYWYFKGEHPLSHSRNDLSFTYTYLRFEKDKEEAFQKGREKYPDRDHMNANCKYIKIHRKEKEE